MAFDLVQWRFVTKVLGWSLDPSLGPSTEDSAADVTETATTFDPATADPDSVKQTAALVRAWADSIRDRGRKPPSTGDTTAWDAHAKTVRSTISDTREMRSKIKTELAKEDLNPEMRSELEALQTQVNDALIEALDLEEAHGPTNHVKISRDGLGKRAMVGVDPRQRGGDDPDGAMRATRFASQDVFLDAFDTALTTEKYGQEIADRTDFSDPDNPVLKADKGGYFSIILSLEEVFGPDYLDQVNGLTFTGTGGERKALFAASKGTADAPTLPATSGVTPTNFKDGTIRVSFKFIDGAWELSTMFPDVAPSVDRKTDAEGEPRALDMVYDAASGQWQKKDPSRGDALHPYDPDTQTWIGTEEGETTDDS